jgi:hypothetical protein
VNIFSFMYEMLYDFCAAFCDNLSFSFILLIIQIKQFHVYVVKKEL